MEKYFKEVISDIEAGLPSIPDDTKIKESEVDRFGALQFWTCLSCTTKNNITMENCQICRNKKPNIKKVL